MSVKFRIEMFDLPEGAAMRGAGRAFHRDVTWVMENLSDCDAGRIFRQATAFVDRAMERTNGENTEQ